jgi:hypothetical protein
MCWWFITNTKLETGGTPVNKLDSTLGLDDGNCGIHVFGYDISAIEQSASHCKT